jgi:hypothetical protein
MEEEWDDVDECMHLEPLQASVQIREQARAADRRGPLFRFVKEGSSPLLDERGEQGAGECKNETQEP